LYEGGGGRGRLKSCPTFDVETAAVLIPAFQADFVAQDGEETLKLPATTLWGRPYSTVIKLQSHQRKLYLTVAEHFVVRELAGFSVEDPEFEIDRAFLFFKQEQILEQQ